MPIPEFEQRALRRLASHCEELGLNVQVVVDRPAIDARFPVNGKPRAARAPAELAPAYRRAIVLGSAGRTFWEGFLNWRQGHADLLPDPLDRFTEQAVEPLVTELRETDASAMAAYPFSGPRQIIPFAALVGDQPWAQSAPFGVAVHPQQGPWFAWRAVVFVGLETPASPAMASPCVSCAAPCAEACPVQAVSKTGFRWQDCADFRVARNRCRETCQARMACPVAPSLRYGPDQMAYHYRASLRMLQARNGKS